jgi:hypothetical protein
MEIEQLEAELITAEA